MAGEQVNRANQKRTLLLPQYGAVLTSESWMFMILFLWCMAKESKPFPQTGKPAVQSVLEPACFAQPFPTFVPRILKMG